MAYAVQGQVAQQEQDADRMHDVGLAHYYRIEADRLLRRVCELRDYVRSAPVYPVGV